MAVIFALSQIIQNLIHISQFNHHGVGNDKRPGNIGHYLQILDRIFFEIDLRRDFKPLHIDPPLCNALFVDEIDRGHIGGGGVASEGSAAQRQRRGIGVVNIADSALGGRRIGNYAAYLHLLAIFYAQVVVVGMDDRRMAQAAQFQHGFGVLEPLFVIFADEVSQHGRKLLQAQRILARRLRQRC